VEPQISVGVIAESELPTFERPPVAAAVLIENRQMRQTDSGGVGRRDDSLREFRQVAIGPAVRCMVQVVEFGDSGITRLEHLHEYLGCNGLDMLGSQSVEELIHQSSPGPEAVVARAGGGIVSTVSATRAESEATLLSDALLRVDALLAEGVSTIEVKSGYGLDTETELKMLRIARAIPRQRPVEIVPSFLGAHAIPPGTGADAYIDEVCLPTLVQAHAEGLVDAVDGFCESIAFSTAQIERVFLKASELGLPIKLHAEQLSNLGGAALASRYGALSVDHVEYASDADARLMAASGTVAVLLPGAFYTLRETQVPPLDAFRAEGVPMAVGTDWNPGSSPLGSLLLAMNMACTLFRMTPEEVLAGTTCHAARALGFSDRGSIAPGMRADVAVWDVAEPAELSYRIGQNPLHQRLFGGDM